MGPMAIVVSIRVSLAKRGTPCCPIFKLFMNIFEERTEEWKSSQLTCSMNTPPQIVKKWIARFSWNDAHLCLNKNSNQINSIFLVHEQGKHTDDVYVRHHYGMYSRICRICEPQHWLPGNLYDKGTELVILIGKFDWWLQACKSPRSVVPGLHVLSPNRKQWAW